MEVTIKNSYITLPILLNMIKSGANHLYNHYEYVNSLNVFPVPDGDTGTNMSLTMKCGIEIISKIKVKSFKSVSKKLNHGLLMGARGNSGVILSQFFRGFCEVVQNVDKKGISVEKLVEAFIKGKERAYASVMKPVEGTILTLTRCISEQIQELDLSKYDILSLFKKIVEIANNTTNETIEMLEVLKEANTVDAGARGLSLILEGFFHALNDNFIEIDLKQKNEIINSIDYKKDVEKFGYCVEMLIKLAMDANEAKIRKDLFNLNGESIVVVKSEDILKIHVHVDSPLQVFHYGESLGELIKSKAENMTMQTNESQRFESQKTKLKELAVISVGSGKGIISEFYELGSDAVFDSANGAPTVDDFLTLAKSAYAKTVIIVPNDKNYLLTAEQAKKQINNIKLRIIETRTMAAGLAALTVFNPEQSLKSNLKDMKKAVKNTKTIELTKAVKDTIINGVKIKKGDIILMENGKIIKSGNSEVELIKDYVDNTSKRSSVEQINVMFGQNFNPTQQNQVIIELEKFKLAEKKFINDAHPVLSLIIGFE